MTDASPPHVRCDYEIEKLAETSGFKILQNPPKGVKLVGCNIKQDGSVRTSPTCFARPDTKFSLTSADAEINLKSVVLTVDAVDEAGGGGSLHTHYLHCQAGAGGARGKGRGAAGRGPGGRGARGKGQGERGGGVG